MSAAIDALAAGEHARVLPLPARMRVVDLVSDFSPLEPRGRATLGAEHRAADFILRTAANGRRARVFFDASLVLLAVLVEMPEETEPLPALLASLEATGARLSGEHALIGAVTERVYGDRGLALISDVRDEYLVACVAFPPAPAAEYVRALRPNADACVLPGPSLGP